MLLRKGLGEKPTIYQAISTMGLCSFNIDYDEVENGTYQIYFRVKKDGNYYASSATRYSNTQGKTFYQFTIDRYLAGDAGAIIAELKKNMIEADAKTEALLEAINEAIPEGDSLVSTIVSAEAQKAELNEAISESVVGVSNLLDSINNAEEAIEIIEGEIAKVPVKIEEINNAGATQISNENASGDKTLNDISNATTSFTNLSNSKISEVNSAGTTQVSNVNKAGTENVTAVNNAGANLDVKIDELNAIADERIEEASNIVLRENTNTGEKFSSWLGTTEEFNAISQKAMGTLYHHFDANGNFVGGFYKKINMNVQRDETLSATELEVKED
jgi:hypothetical protein